METKGMGETWTWVLSGNKAGYIVSGATAERGEVALCVKRRGSAGRM